MMRLGMVVLLAGLALPAVAQDVPKSFPMDRTFKGLSIDKTDVRKSGVTLTVSREAATRRVFGSGSASCNNWSATFAFRGDGELDIAEAITTRKFCGEAIMATESAFLAALKAVRRWRLDDKKRLVLEGGPRLVLTGGAAASDKKQTKSSR